MRWAAHLRRESHRFLLLVVVVAGALCGATAVAFHALISLAYGSLAGAALHATRAPLRVAAVLLVPALMGALLALLVPRLSPDAGGGLTLVRSAYARDAGRLDLRAWLGTLIANPLSLGAGTPLGPEGPTVVLTAGLATGLARMLRLPARLVRGMVPLGTAAGIAAIFNTPITGVVFALEEVVGTASRGVLGGAIVAAVAAAVVQKQALGGAHLLPAAPAGWRSATELLGFAALGLVSGAAAGVVPRIVPPLRQRLQRLTPRLWLRGGLAGLAVGALGLLAPDMLGVGYPAVSRWLSGGGDASSAALAFAAKAVGVVVALAAGLVGGVFAPSLFLGASLGAAFGHALHALAPHTPVDPAAYALVGMGAFFAGFLRTPLASVLIVFELTGDYELVLPLMLAVALSSLVARRVSPNTLVERQLEEQGVPGHESGSDPLALRRARDAMSAPAATLAAAATLSEAWQQVGRLGHSVYPVVDEQERCIGLIDLHTLAGALRHARGDEPVEAYARPARVQATPDEPLDRITLRLAAEHETRCPVIESPENPRLLGILTPADFLHARLRAAVEQRGTSFEPLER